jgi:putative MATE family efflux protein
MAGMMTGAVLNIGLDPLFIFVFKMGVAGAALATAISQAASFCLLLYGCSRKGNVRISPRNFAPGLRLYKEMLRGGIPSLFRQGIAAVASICVNMVARGYGDAAIAAIAIVQRVTMFANSALIGFGQGFQPVCGFNYGARKFGRVRKAFWFCVRVATVVMSVAAVLMFAFAPGIIAIFRRGDPDVIEIGSYYLRLQCPLLPLWGFALMSNMMLQTIGESMRASILAVARQGLFMIPLLYILTPLFGLRGIQFSQPVSDLATFLLTIPLTFSVLKRMAQTPEES